MGGWDPRITKVKEQMDLGTNFSDALDLAGFSPDEMGNIMGKAMQWYTSDQQVAGGVAEFEKTMKGREKAEELAQKTSDDTAKVAESGALTAEDMKRMADGSLKNGTLYFKMPRRILNGEYKKAVQAAVTKGVEEGVLDPIRTALFEYYMYSGLDREGVAKTLATGMTITDFASRVGTAAQKGVLPEDEFTGMNVAEPEEKQHGGLVSGVSKGGLAIFRRPPGEGVTGIRPGERIVPAYGGGGGGGGRATADVRVSLSPDAQKLIQTEVSHGIYEHERHKRTAG
jgi:hypothetical protein